MAKMGRILAIDYGRVRIGLALSDFLKRIALPLKVVIIPKGTKDIALFLFEVIQKIPDLDQILIGHPLLMNATKGEMAQEVEAFAEKLSKLTPLPLLLWDERFTSCIAEQSLKEMGFSRKQRKDKTDPTAATLLLQSYLDSLS
jgi:putative Holliday junction resolvase